MEHNKDFKLIVNKDQKNWADQFITGAQILELAGSPADWVVNQLVPGSGEDPEIGAAQRVDLDLQAEPHGVKRFQTRKPKTNPGS
ncbi:MAG: multiubiquitin domain-containing protein [Acidobacteria bacterium]|nr:multiubiquitin domain-containing protein [Acidobacteriota bacterium]MBV9475072.1 multiubiquitin domain-containing protein [Acidobacteriota bacterium]